jgi:hypothetical protein
VRFLVAVYLACVSPLGAIADEDAPAAPAAPAAAPPAAMPPAPAAPQVTSAPRPPGGTPAPPPIPRLRLVLNNLLIARYNPLGFEDQIRFGVQHLLYRSDRSALRENFFFAGIHPKLNPAFAKVGPSVEIQPVSFFNLRAVVEFIGFFSTFGYLQSFPTAAADYSDSTQKTRRDGSLNYSTTGLHVYVEPMVTLKFGPILLRDKVAIEYWQMGVRGADRVWYDATLDTLVPANGWVVTNDADLAFIKRFRTTAQLVIGARHSLVFPIYSRAEFGDKDPSDAERAAAATNFHHRLGPLVAFTFFDRGYSGWNKPTLILIAGWYLQHRWRTGADTPEALPYMVLAFSFQSDLLKP